MNRFDTTFKQLMEDNYSSDSYGITDKSYTNNITKLPLSSSDFKVGMRIRHKNRDTEYYKVIEIQDSPQDPCIIAKSIGPSHYNPVVGQMDTLRIYFTYKNFYTQYYEREVSPDTWKPFYKLSTDK